MDDAKDTRYGFEEITEPGVVLRERRAGYSTRGYDFDDATGAIIGCALEVHRTLGPGFEEVIYQRALAYELPAHDLEFDREVWIEVVCTQMTKMGLLTSFVSWNDIANLNLFVVDDDTIDEKLNQFPALFECRLFQSFLNTLTECLNRRSYGSYFKPLLSLRFYPAQLIP